MQQEYCACEWKMESESEIEMMIREELKIKGEGVVFLATLVTSKEKTDTLWGWSL